MAAPAAYDRRVRVLIVGGTGLLGQELLLRCIDLGHQSVGTFARWPGEAWATWRHLDLRSDQDVTEVLGDVRPEIVINAAYAGADWQVTALGAARLARHCHAARIRLVQVSSDALFAGRPFPYAETDDPSPITSYGAAKAAAEVAAASIDPGAIIARSSLIISSDGSSQPERFVHELAAGGEGFLFTDEYRCPVHVADLAAALVELAASNRSGIHHVGGADAVSRLELGRLIAARDGLDAGALRSRTQDMEKWRPRDVRLDSRATQAVLATRLRGAREFLA